MFLIRFLIKLIAWTWLIYPRYLWSHIHRLLFEQKYKKVQLPIINRQKDIKAILKQINWTPDSIKKLGDAVPYPETVWATKRDDCDGFAILACKLLEQLGVKGYLYTYIPKDFTKSHTICVYRYPDKIYSFSNAASLSPNVRDFQKFKDKFFPDRIVDDLRDINFKRIKDF